jgi:hypothetical protein
MLTYLCMLRFFTSPRSCNLHANLAFRLPCERCSHTWVCFAFSPPSDCATCTQIWRFGCTGVKGARILGYALLFHLPRIVQPARKSGVSVALV